MKYDLSEATIANADKIEQWAFFFLLADGYDTARLLKLLPGADFQQAISSADAIAQKTEDKQMYDQRHKAQLDSQWLVEGALKQGREEGLEKGLEKGTLIGKIQALQQLLGESESPTAAFADHSPQHLTTVIDDLQRRLRDRNT